MQVRQDSFVFAYDAYLAATAIRWRSVLWRRHNIAIFLSMLKSRVVYSRLIVSSIAKIPPRIYTRSWLPCYSSRVVADWFNTLTVGESYMQLSCIRLMRLEMQRPAPRMPYKVSLRASYRVSHILSDERSFILVERWCVEDLYLYTTTSIYSFIYGKCACEANA